MSGIQYALNAEGIDTVAVSAVVAGGQFVDADADNSVANGTKTCAPSGAASVIAMGVALIDAAPAGTDSSTDADARPPSTTIARAGKVVPVTFAAASNYGDRLKTAASGQVTPWVDGTDDPAKIVAVNVDPAGSVAEAATGLVSVKVG